MHPNFFVTRMMVLSQSYLDMSNSVNIGYQRYERYLTYIFVYVFIQFTTFLFTWCLQTVLTFMTSQGIYTIIYNIIGRYVYWCIYLLWLSDLFFCLYKFLYISNFIILFSRRTVNQLKLLNIHVFCLTVEIRLLSLAFFVILDFV